MPLNWLKPNMASEWMELYANFYVKYSKKDITSHGMKNSVKYLPTNWVENTAKKK